MVNRLAPGYGYPLSRMVEHRLLLRVQCHSCRRVSYYRPEDVIQLFGDVDVNSLQRRIKCGRCRSNNFLHIETFQPAGSDLSGIRVRRLVGIKLLRVPIWKED